LLGLLLLLLGVGLGGCGGRFRRGGGRRRCSCGCGRGLGGRGRRGVAVAGAAALVSAVGLVVLAGWAVAGAPAIEAPLTVSPPCEKVTEFLSPMPLTRSTMSGQSLNLAFARSSMIFCEMLGPMPLIVSSSAWLAVLASTAKAENAKNAASATRIFLNMPGLLAVVGSAAVAVRAPAATE
jgi:hypothetical protein